MSEAIRATLKGALNTNSDVCIIRETYAGIGGTSTGLEDAVGPERVLTLPIADRAALATAVGMACEGSPPTSSQAARHRIGRNRFPPASRE